MMSPKGKITVIIADDTLIAREGWKKILETSEEIKIIGEARTASQATKIATELKPQVILMDLKWFGDDTAGSAAIKEIKTASPEVKVIAVTAYENLIRDARLAGADSALSKTFTREALLNEIHEQASLTKKIKILVADDTLIAREGWKRILETADFLEVVGEAQTTSEILGKIQETNIDILLMDFIWFGDENAGWKTIREIKNKYPDVQVIVVSAYEYLAQDARRAGADAVLLKTFTRDELLSLISKLAINKYSYPLQTGTTIEKLTEREKDILELIAAGHRDKEIALLLGIASITAKNHVKSILEKLGAKNRTQAVSLAKGLGLIK
jgi:DNA-binding NarL/FixJ family response regulator